jgi:8-hydroxy-5-deazaflavin:NADPH oxidoreductase
MGRIAILGGTGPEGLGLGMRFAMAGEAVVIGSRQPQRAAEAAGRAVERLRAGGYAASLRGVENRAAVEGADLVVVATPFAGVMELLPPLAPILAGKVVLDVVNPLVRVNKQFTIEDVPEGSAAEAIQRVLAESQVVAAFKNESAEELNVVEHPVEGDIVVCSDHAEARSRVMALVNRLPRYRAVDGGPLINARSVEAITALLLNINRRYRAVTSIKILGLPDRVEPA